MMELTASPTVIAFSFFSVLVRFRISHQSRMKISIEQTLMKQQTPTYLEKHRMQIKNVTTG
jgi:hypothetical protein